MVANPNNIKPTRYPAGYAWGYRAQGSGEAINQIEKDTTHVLEPFNVISILVKKGGGAAYKREYWMQREAKEGFK